MPVSEAGRCVCMQALAQSREMSDSAMALVIQVNDALNAAVQGWQAASARLPQKAAQAWSLVAVCCSLQSIRVC